MIRLASIGYDPKNETTRGRTTNMTKMNNKEPGIAERP
jgi:hypothetical protein